MPANIAIIENHIISTNTVRLVLTKYLIQLGYNVTVLSTGTAEELGIAKSRGIAVIDVGTSNTNPKEVFTYINTLRTKLKLIKADVCLTFTMRPAIWGNMVTRFLGIPTITNITGIGPLSESDSFVYKTARVLYKFVLKKTHTVFFQNEDDRNLFLSKKFVTPAQAALIPGSGVDYEYFSPLPKKSTNSKFTFLFISRLIKDKGITEYVEASRILKDKGFDMELQVLGPYYSQNLKENIITEKEILKWVEQRIVKYLGASDDVRSFIAEADCVVLPSYREGMSNVLLEAGSMEKPCVTSDVTGCRDIVVDGETGLLCKPKDAVHLAEKMQEMFNLSNDERLLMGKKARNLVKTKFAKQLVIDAYVSKIEGILNKN